ncbi:TM0106 family RecB-like putative nuclease [Candidatus Foliamicus sp.]
MDLFGDPSQRDAPNPFVETLWEDGARFEREVMEGLAIPYVDLKPCASDEREHRTLEAMEREELLIYGGRIQEGELLGDPDLLRREGDGYIAGDVKSGSGEQGSKVDAKPKTKYAVQLGLYTDILERKGLSAGRRAFVWDIKGREVTYDYTKPVGKRNPRTLWEVYQECLEEAMAIVRKEADTLAAYGSACKQCHWYNACLSQLSAADDLTLIPELGRSRRDAMRGAISTIHDFAALDPAEYVKGSGTAFSGINSVMLARFHARAKLISAGSQAQPYLRKPVNLPQANRELFFDIETDPMRDICYLHGFVERQSGDKSNERYVAFFADEATAEAERRAFAQAWAYMQERMPCAIYYYTKFERTLYRKLREKYPDVCSEEQLEALFHPLQAIDLYYCVVFKASEWPTRDYSLKTLAQYLGFDWRDTHPSGAASIEWFHKWLETGDSTVRQRILEYNEDDCRAMRVLLDEIAALPVIPEAG